MFSPIRNRFGIPGVISVIALVFAMLGGAYAATNSGGGKATASAQGKRGPRGPKGPKGDTGPAGPAGPQGPAGASGRDGANGLDGENGEKGKDGKDGKNGTNGASVTNTVEPAGANCAEGGSKFVVGAGTPTYACNGEEGEEGEEGSPWTAGGTLPPGETETGTWAFQPPPHVSCTVSESVCTAKAEPNSSAKFLLAPISFPIPLEAALDEEHTIYMSKGKSPEPHCSGTPGNPQADPGYLCVYTGEESPGEATGFVFIGKASENLNPTGADQSGALVTGAFWEGDAFAFGTWAVTAATTP